MSVNGIIMSLKVNKEMSWFVARALLFFVSYVAVLLVH